MKSKLKMLISGLLCFAMLVSVASCSSGEDESIEAARTTLDSDAALIAHMEEISDQVDGTIQVTKKIAWLSHWPIDETQAACELFKAVYGIPEEGNEDYGDDANNIFDYIYTAYPDRYDKLSTMISGGDAPDIFQFEILNYPYSAYKNMYQPIDDLFDFSDSKWDATRNAIDQFTWGGETYLAIVIEQIDQVLWYRRSVAEEAGLDDPYELFRAGNWTWDTFLEMADKFQNSGDGKYFVDGWQACDKLMLACGVPLISLSDEGLLQSNLNNPTVERAMEFLATLYKEDYRYPRHTLNGYGISLPAWVAGDTLFMSSDIYYYKDTLVAYRDRYGWDSDDVFFVPFPRDSSADAYYHSKSANETYMLVNGSDNIEGYQAWIQCLLATVNDEETHVLSDEKMKNDYGYTQEMLDFQYELVHTDILTGLYDFKGGIGQDIADGNTIENPVDCLTQIPYLTGESSYTELRAENEGIINNRIEELNATVS